MRFGGAFRGEGGIALRRHFIKLLRRHHALLVEAFHAVVRFLRNGRGCFRLLPHLVCRLFLLGACALIRLLLLRLGSLSCGRGLFEFRRHVGGFEACQRVATVHEVAFFHAQFENASRHFARYAVFRHVGLTLNKVGLRTISQITAHGGKHHQACYYEQPGQDFCQ